MQLTLGQLAERLEAEVRGDAEVVIRSVAGIREAGEGDVTFLANSKYRCHLSDTRASAVIVSKDEAALETPCLLTADPYRTYLMALEIFGKTPDRPDPGIDPTAVVHSSAKLGRDVTLGAHVVVCADAEIGDDTVIMAGCYIGHRVQIGSNGVLFPNVVIREDVQIGDKVLLHPGVVLGSDGFGFAPTPEGNHKIPQIGTVILGEDVEIGSNSTIDRATTGVTRIRQGTRIDNLVHIAHNVDIGEHSILCAQVGISGSVELGKRVVVGGQAGIVGHIEIGDGARVAAQGGVTKSIPPGKSVSGYPAITHSKAQRIYASMRTLPDALKALRDMEKRIVELETRLHDEEARELESNAAIRKGGTTATDE